MLVAKSGGIEAAPKRLERSKNIKPWENSWGFFYAHTILRTLSIIG